MLHHDEIVLLQMQLFIRHDYDFCGIFALEIFNSVLFLILKQSSDRRMGAHDDPLLFDLPVRFVGSRGKFRTPRSWATWYTHGPHNSGRAPRANA